ncbi:hypothetical protein Vretimale_5387, partial [Volvox reticuliferus]
SCRAAGKPTVQPIFISAPSNILPAQLLLPPPRQSRQLAAGSGAALIAVASPPAVTYTSLPRSMAVQFSRPSLISTTSWRSRSGAKCDGDAGVVSRIGPSGASFTSQQGGGSTFPMGSIEDSFSLSLRHQLQAEVKRTNSRINNASGAVAAGVVPSLLSSTPEHDLSRPSEGESEEEFDLTPRTQPRLPLHQDDKGPPTNAFASGVIGAVTPAVRTLAFAAVAAANSPSASVGSILPLLSRTGQGLQHGSTGDGSSSTPAGWNGGSGGDGSACSSSASGMLQQALRQHQSYARRQLRQQKQQQLQQQATMQSKQQHPWNMIVAEPAVCSPPLPVCNPLHPETMDAALLHHPAQRQPAPSAAVVADWQQSPGHAARTFKGGGNGGRGREPSCDTIVPNAGASSGAADVSKLSQQQQPPQPLLSAPAPRVGLGAHRAPVGVTSKLQADSINTTISWPSEVRAAAKQGYGTVGGGPTSQPYATHGQAEAVPILATAPTSAAGKAENASLESSVKVPHDTGKAFEHDSQTCPGGGAPRHPNARKELDSCSSPFLDTKGLSAGKPHNRALGQPAGESKDGEELTGVSGGGTAANAPAVTDRTEEDEGAALRDGMSLFAVGRAGSKAEPVAMMAVAASAGIWHGIAPPVTGRVPQPPHSGATGHPRAWSGARQRVHVQGSTGATDSALSNMFQYRWGQSPVGNAPGCNVVPALGSGGLVGNHWPSNTDGYAEGVARGPRATSMQGHYGSPAAAALSSAVAAAESGVRAASSSGGSQVDARLDPGLRNPAICRASRGDRTASSQLYTQVPQPVQPQRFFVPTGFGSSVTGDLGGSSFMASAGGEVYELYEHSAVSEDCDDSRTSARPPAGWRPGVHPPQAPGGGSAAATGPLPGARTFGRLGSLATRSDSTSTHGCTPNVVSCLAEGSTGAGGRKGCGTLARGGLGGAAATITVPSGSACTLSLAPVHSACYNLDEPELWRDETYTEPLGLEG